MTSARQPTTVGVKDELAARRAPPSPRATLRLTPDGDIELDDPSLDGVLVWPAEAARDLALQILRLTRKP